MYMAFKFMLKTRQTHLQWRCITPWACRTDKSRQSILYVSPAVLIRFCRHSDFKTSVVARTRDRPKSHSEPDRCSHETMGCLRRAHRLCGESDVVTAPHSNLLAACVSFACTRRSSGCGIVGAGGFRTTISQTVLYSLATSLTIWGPSKPRCFALHRSSRYVAVRLLHTVELLS